MASPSEPRPRQSMPGALQDGGLLPETRGYEWHEWIIEEDQGASCLGFKTLKKLHEEHSPYQKLCVYDTALFGKLLALDDVLMLSERDEFVYHEMLVHVPLCSLPEPKRVLIVGGGDCGCLREVLKHPGVEHVVQCELDERVVRVCQRFFPWVSPSIDDPRAELVFEDARAYLEASSDHFDLIIVDSTDPKGPAAQLFRREFYQIVATRLTDGGVLTAQTESPAWDPLMVGAIYGELRQAFSMTCSYLAMTPSYPSGCWSLAYASQQGRPAAGPIDAQRASQVAKACLYYNPQIHRAAFALPNFARRVVAGEDPFAGFNARYLEHLRAGRGPDSSG